MDPKISLLVALGTSSRQADSTLYSLSVAYQRDVAEQAYELVLVDGDGAEPLGAALERSRAPLLGFVDAACLVTPGLIAHALKAARLAEQPIIVAPAYEPLPTAGDFYEHVDWKRHPDELFRSSRFSDINPNGYLCSVTRAALFFCARSTYDELRAAPEAPELWTPDELFAKLCALPECRLIVLGGEGCFRRSRRDESGERLRDLWQRTDRQPLLFGTVAESARPFLRISLEREAIHAALHREAGREQWPNEHACRMRLTAPSRTPSISLVVFVFGIPRQAENTLYSLSAAHQRNVREEDYEIIVVEHRSAAMLGEKRALELGGNIRYFERNGGPDAFGALSFGVARAEGTMLGMLLDGARVVTPGTLEQAFLALRAHERPLCAVPGYHLRSALAQDNAAELELLESVAWRNTGYRLFEIASADMLSLGSLNSFLDGTCLFWPRSCLDEIGGISALGERALHHDLFERFSTLERTELVVLWSEGTFHQYHRGVPSGSAAERTALVTAFFGYVAALRNRRYQAWTRRSELLGICAAPAEELLKKAAWLGLAAQRNGRAG